MITKIIQLNNDILHLQEYVENMMKLYDIERTFEYTLLKWYIFGVFGMKGFIIFLVISKYFKLVNINLVQS
jgi:hypothetical protein